MDLQDVKKIGQSIGSVKSDGAILNSQRSVNLPTPIVDDRVGPKGMDIAVVFENILTLTYWDLWCLLATQKEHQGNLNLLREALVHQRLTDHFRSFFRRNEVEDLIALVEDLSERLKPIGTAQDILEKLTKRIIKKESQKAIRNIIKQEGGHLPSEPMLKSPRRLLEREAYRGMWNQLPVDPTPIAERLSSLFILPEKHGYFSEGKTFALSRRIEKRIKRELVCNDSIAHRYAVFRASLTLFHEQHCWDDSYGNMGDLGTAWVEELLLVTPRSICLSANLFLKDLLMFLCWEEYGLSCSDKVAKYIQEQLSKDEYEIAIQILQDIKKRAELGFQKSNAEEAIRILNLLNITTDPIFLGGKLNPLRLISSKEFST